MSCSSKLFGCSSIGGRSLRFFVYNYTEVNLFLCTIKLVLLGVVCELRTLRVSILGQFLQEYRFEEKVQYLWTLVPDLATSISQFSDKEVSTSRWKNWHQMDLQPENTKINITTKIRVCWSRAGKVSRACILKRVCLLINWLQISFPLPLTGEVYVIKVIWPLWQRQCHWS